MSSENSDNVLTSPGFEKVHSSRDISEIDPDVSSVKVEISASEGVEPFKGDTSKECSLSVQSLSHLSLSAENFEDPFTKCDNIRQVSSTFHPFKSVSTPHRQVKRKFSSADSSSKKLKCDNVPLETIPDSRLFEERSFENLDPDVLISQSSNSNVPQTETPGELAIGVPLISSTDSARSSNSFSIKPDIKEEYLFKSPDSQVVSSESENTHLKEEIEFLKQKCDSLQQKLRSKTACKDCRQKTIKKGNSGLEDITNITKIQSEYSAVIAFSYNFKTNEPVSLHIEQINSGSSSHQHSSGSLLSGELADVSSESVNSVVCTAVSCSTVAVPANSSSTSSSVASSASSYGRRRKATLIRVSNGSTCNFPKPASCICSCYCSQFFDPKPLSHNISSPKLASSSSSERIKMESSVKPANMTVKRKRKSKENIKLEDPDLSENTTSDVTSSVTSIKSKRTWKTKSTENVAVRHRTTSVQASLKPENVIEGKRARKKTTHYTPNFYTPSQLKKLFSTGLLSSSIKKRGRKSLKEKQAKLSEDSFDETVSKLEEITQKSTGEKKKNSSSESESAPKLEEITQKSIGKKKKNSSSVKTLDESASKLEEITQKSIGKKKKNSSSESESASKLEEITQKSIGKKKKNSSSVKNLDESASKLKEITQKSTGKKKKNLSSVKKEPVRKRRRRISSKESKTVKTPAPASATRTTRKTSEKKTGKVSGPHPSTSKCKKTKAVEILFRSDVVSEESDSDVSDVESECNFSDVVGGELDEEVYPVSDSKRKSTGDRILKSSTKSNVKVPEELSLVNILGPIPRSSLFEGYHFVITHAGPKSYYKEAQISNSELSVSEPESDVETSASFDIVRLRTQIIAGKGSVYKYLTQIHKEDLDKTIVISDCPCQTPNYLLSATLNIPVYSHEVIITACIKNTPVKQFLKMEFRLAVGRTSDGNWRNFDSCRKPKPLKDFLVILASTDNNSRLKLWASLLKNLGAKVSLNTPTKSSLACVGSAGLIIVDDFCPMELKDIALKESISVVSTRWLIDTIIRGKKEADTQSKYYQVNLSDV